MLIMLTTVCNMSCAHCCMSTGKDFKGQHMDETTYIAALELSNHFDDLLTLSGGEPTLHPRFKEFYLWAQYSNTGEYPAHVITNGSKNKTALWLLDVTSEQYALHDWLDGQRDSKYNTNWFPVAEGTTWSSGEAAGVELSYDQWHDKSMVAPEVLNGFRTRKAVRHHSEPIQAGHYTGSAKRQNCVCATLQIKPNGDIFTCGCNNAPMIGNVMDSDIYSKVEIAINLLRIADNCVNGVEYAREHDDDLTPEIEREFFDMLPRPLLTNIEWAQSHILVKRGKQQSPDNHRPPLEHLTELPSSKVSEWIIQLGN